jgi:hypothetical protein
MKKGLVVLADRVKVLNEADKRGAVEAAKPGSDADLACNCFLIPDHAAIFGARYPGDVRVHHPGISPEVNGEKPWILFKT